MTMAIIFFIQNGFVGGEIKPGLQLVSKYNYLSIIKITSFPGAELQGENCVSLCIREILLGKKVIF